MLRESPRIQAFARLCKVPIRESDISSKWKAPIQSTVCSPTHPRGQLVREVAGGVRVASLALVWNSTLFSFLC